MVTVLSKYLNQTAVWDKKTGVNDYNEPVCNTYVINVRKVKKDTLTIVTGGNKVLSKATFTTKEIIQEGDRLDGYVVLSVEEMTGYNGKAIGYIAKT